MEAGPAHPLAKVPSRPTFSRPPFCRPPFPQNIPATRPVQMNGPVPASQDYRPVAQERRNQEYPPLQGRRQGPAGGGGRPAPRHAAPAPARDNWRRRRTDIDSPYSQEPINEKTYPRMVHVEGFPSYTRVHDLVHAFSEFGPAKVDRIVFQTACLVFKDPEDAAAAVRASTTVCLYGEFLTVKPFTKSMEYQREERTRLEAEKAINYRREVDNKTKGKGPTVDPSTISWEGDFDAQLDALLTAVRLTQHEIQRLSALYHDLHTVLKRIWPDCLTIPFGSVTTGLGVKASDADCFVLVPEGAGGGGGGQAVLRARRQLAHHPRLFSALVAIPNANTPIVKFFHLPTRTHCDVSFKTLLGVQNSKLIGFLLSADPRLLPLAVVIKYWASVHELSGTGKLTNYALTMLIIFYLQQPPHPILPSVAWLQSDRATDLIVDGWNTGFMSEHARLPPTTNTSSIAELIGGFFQFYSSFPFTDAVVSPYLGYYLTRYSWVDYNQLPEECERYKANVAAGAAPPLRANTPMCVQDPFEQCHNVASPVTTRLAADLKSYIKFAADTYEQEKSGDCRHFLETILLDKPKLPRGKTKTEFRVTVRAHQLANIGTMDWRTAADDVVDCIFNTVLELDLQPVQREVSEAGEDAPESPQKNRKKVKYTAVLTRAIWKRRRYTKVYSAMRLRLYEREKYITQEIMTADKNVIHVPFQLAVTYINSPRTVIMAIRPGAGDLQAFKEFGKFFQNVMLHWFVVILKPYCDKPDMKNGLPTTSGPEHTDEPPAEVDENTPGSDDSDSSSDESTEDERTPDAQTESHQDNSRQSDSEKSPSDTDKENVEGTNNVVTRAVSADNSQSPKTENDKGTSHKDEGNVKNPSDNKNTPQHKAGGNKARRKRRSNKTRNSNSAIKNGEL